jgi:antitoxin component YwqK of YwqJK toxin-antitoxin module
MDFATQNVYNFKYPMKPLFYVITSVLIILSSCTNETQSYKLNLNENTYLLDGEPYTGLVIDKKKKTGRISRSFECIDGKIEGQYLQYFDNGKVYLKQRYLHGKLNGLSKQFNSNGSPRYYHTYKNGKEEGKQIIFDHYNANSDQQYWGDIDKVYTLKNGILDGYFHDKSGYYPHPKGYYKNGKMEGLWIYYGHPDINPIEAIGRFKNGSGSNLGETGIPRNGRIGKWYFYYPGGKKAIQVWNKNSEWYISRGFNEFGDLVYHAKLNSITEEEIVYLDKL